MAFVRRVGVAGELHGPDIVVLGNGRHLPRVYTYGRTPAHICIEQLDIGAGEPPVEGRPWRRSVASPQDG
jgi:hypothetical protein